MSMIDSLSEVEGSIIDVKTELEELDSELQNLHWEVFDKVQDNFNNLHSEIDNLVGLFDDIDVVDDNGMFSKEALSNLGLLTQKFELAEYQVTSYGEQIAKLNQDYLDGKYSLLEYQEKLAELSEEQWNAVNASEEVRDAIISLHELRVDEIVDSIEEEKEAYREVIEAQLELIDATEDLINKREELEGKSKTVTDLERQIAAMMNDDSQATVAKRLKVEEELTEAKKDLESTERKFSVESQKEALQKQLEDFESEKDNEIDILKASLEDQEKLIADSFEIVKQNAFTVGQHISTIAKKHGVQVSNALTSSWKQGQNAIASYGSVLSEQSSAFIGNIMGVENEVWNLQAQANNTANTLTWMLSTQSDNLVNELNTAAYAEYNLMNATNALQNSLVNTLERGYDVSSITSALNTIEASAKSTGDALRNLGNIQVDAQTEPESVENKVASNVGVGRYCIVDNASGRQISHGFTTEEDAREHLAKYAYIYSNKYKKGVSVSAYASGTRNTKGNIIITDEEGYELKLPKLNSGNYTIANEGSQILTKTQTDNIFDWSKFNPVDIMPKFKPIDLPKMSGRNNNPIQIHNSITFTGAVNDANNFEKQIAKIADTQITKSWKEFCDSIKY